MQTQRLDGAKHLELTVEIHGKQEAQSIDEGGPGKSSKTWRDKNPAASLLPVRLARFAFVGNQTSGCFTMIGGATLLALLV